MSCYGIDLRTCEKRFDCFDSKSSEDQFDFQIKYCQTLVVKDLLFLLLDLSSYRGCEEEEERRSAADWCVGFTLATAGQTQDTGRKSGDKLHQKAASLQATIWKGTQPKINSNNLDHLAFQKSKKKKSYICVHVIHLFIFSK